MNRVGLTTIRLALPAVVLAALLAASAGQTVALDLDPFEYYEFDYDIAFSDDTVEPEQPFTVTLSIDIRCINDMPIGAKQAAVEVDITAHPFGPGDEIALLDGFGIQVDDVPDWAGDTLSVSESAEMSFPAGAVQGQYEIAAEVRHVSIDGWNVTPLIPRDYKTIPFGSIACEHYEPAPPQPLPKVEPGTLGIYILGHDFSLAVDEDGILSEPLSAELVEDQVALSMDEGTRCFDSSLEPLEHISVVRDTSPEPFRDGLVLSAYSLQPDGARFSPTITMQVAYPDVLPGDVAPGELLLAVYDDAGESWKPLDTVLDTTRCTVSTQVPHFSTYALLAPTSESLPAMLSEKELSLHPEEVLPYSPVEVSLVVENSGGNAGTYHFQVAIDGRPEHTEDFVVEQGESQTVRTTIARALPGDYEVTVGSLEGTFTVAPQTDSASEQNEVTAPAMPPNPDKEVSSEDSGARVTRIVLLALATLALLTVVVLVLLGVL